MMTTNTVSQSQTVIAPPFTLVTALRKVRLAEDAWNSRDPKRVALAYSEGSVWRNRSEFDESGLMRRREASINDVAIPESDRKFFWPAPGSRPTDHPGIPDVQ